MNKTEKSRQFVLMEREFRYTRMKTMHDINMKLLRENIALREENENLKKRLLINKLRSAD